MSNAANDNKVSSFPYRQIGDSISLLAHLMGKRNDLLSHLVVNADGGLHFGVVPIYIHMDTAIVVIECEAFPIHVIVGSITHPVGDWLGEG